MSEIIQFPGAARRPARKAFHKPPTTEGTAIAERTLTPMQLRREGKPELPPPATETARNARIRSERRDAWWLAERTAEYWHARLEWTSALALAQEHGIGDSDSFAPADRNGRYGSVGIWRAAVAKQLTTPAPTLAVIAWKRAQRAGRGFSHLPISRERAERAIADDEAFLAAHPTRRSNSEAMAKRHRFNEAMRQRIRDFAVSRGLSDEDIKPVLKLKHQEIFRFSEAHGVNIGWLLEGTGPIFSGPHTIA